MALNPSSLIRLALCSLPVYLKLLRRAIIQVIILSLFLIHEATKDFAKKQGKSPDLLIFFSIPSACQSTGSIDLSRKSLTCIPFSLYDQVATLLAAEISLDYLLNTLTTAF